MGRGAEVRTNASGGEVGVESGVGCCSSGPRCGAGLAQLPPSLQREGLALRVPGEQVPLASGAAGLGAHLTHQAAAFCGWPPRTELGLPPAPGTKASPTPPTPHHKTQSSAWPGACWERGRDRGCLGLELAWEVVSRDFGAQALARDSASGQGQCDSWLNGVLGLGGPGPLSGFKGEWDRNLGLEGPTWEVVPSLWQSCD